MKSKTHEIQYKNSRASVVSRRQKRAFVLCAFLILILPAAIDGKTFAKYREDVENARISVEDLIYADAEEMSPAEFKEYERAAIAEIRAALPPTEKVEWQDSTIETDNQWLNDTLNEIEKDALDSSKRESLLTEIGERLGAIEQKLDGLENPKSVSAARSKDEDKQKLAEILRREEYQKPEEKPESFFARTWRQFKEWLAEKFSQANVPDAPSIDGLQSLSLVLQLLLYALILGAIAFLIRRFAPFFAAKFKSRKRKEKRERVILGERIGLDETPANLFAEAENLARTGDLRGAIRKGYVALLCDLSDRKIIGLARHKTNRDYLRDVRPRRELYENMHGLTANFERHWYGFDRVEEKDWEEFRNGYKRTITN